MPKPRRSDCPINAAVELIGDAWSLIVLRDIMFGGRRRFRELLAGSEERIASNVLADRLKSLTEAGLLTRTADPTHKQKIRYGLTEEAIALVPVFATLGAWGARRLQASAPRAVHARMLAGGGPVFWAAFMDELRVTHLGAAPPSGDTPSDRLRAAYAAATPPTQG